MEKGYDKLVSCFAAKLSIACLLIWLKY